MQHILQTLRTYLDLTQAKLASGAGVTQADVSEMETKPPYGQIHKYQRVASYLGVPVDILIRNSYPGMPEDFFEKHPKPKYLPMPEVQEALLGRWGEELILRRERERLSDGWPGLAKLVLPFFKMKCPSPGYDILSYDDDGIPYYIEVKTSSQQTNCFQLTRHEYETAEKVTAAGERYIICYISNWGSAEQTIREIPFSKISNTHRVAPAYYRCTPKPKPEPISGLAYYRLQQELRQEDMAEALGINQHELSLYETGQRGAPVTFYLKASDFLDVPIDQLLEKYEAAQ